MPRRGGGVRKKRRTHKGINEDEEKKIPKSFVIKRGNITASVKELVADWRVVMAPYSATKLKEHKKNKIKDFVSVAGVFGVTHVMVFTQSAVSPYMKIARLPAGPTLTFRIHQFSVRSDVRAQQKKVRVSFRDFEMSPLVVLNGFRQTEETSPTSPPLKLLSTVLGNMFPVIDLNSLSAKDCRRVVLFNYDKTTGLIDVRHYAVIKRPSGVSKSIKKLIRLKNNPKKLLDLRRKNDMTDFILDGTGYESESEVEDTTEISTLTNQQTKEGTTEVPSKLAISMHEIGPRMKIELLKIEEEVSTGKVLYHKLVKKSTEELEILDAKEKELKKKRQRESEELKRLIEKKRKLFENLDESSDDKMVKEDVQKEVGNDSNKQQRDISKEGKIKKDQTGNNKMAFSCGGSNRNGDSGNISESDNHSSEEGEDIYDEEEEEEEENDSSDSDMANS